MRASVQSEALVVGLHGFVGVQVRQFDSFLAKFQPFILMRFISLSTPLLQHQYYLNELITRKEWTFSECIVCYSFLFGGALAFLDIIFVQEYIMNSWWSVLLLVLESGLIMTLSNQHPMLHFIRHAESEFNQVAQACELKYGPNYLDSQEYLAEKFSHKHLDVEITEKGVQQAIQAREIVHKLQVDIVLVSPMRRALHTCAIIFEGHPSKPAIIVEPSFREIMESSNDIGSKLEESIKLYPTFNFENITDKQAWFISTLSNQEDKVNILKKLQGLTGSQRKKVAIEESLTLMKQNWFQRRKDLEQQQALKVRVLPDYQEQKVVLDFYSKKYQRIAIVAHSECIKKYAGYKIKNCEVFSISHQMLQ